jgi:MFS family permease
MEVPRGFGGQVGRKRVYMAALVFFALSCRVLMFARGFVRHLGIALYGVYGPCPRILEALLIDRFIAREREGKAPSPEAVANAADTAGLAAGSLFGGLGPMARFHVWLRLGRMTGPRGHAGPDPDTVAIVNSSSPETAGREGRKETWELS